jgi:hypothetical protein
MQAPAENVVEKSKERGGALPVFPKALWRRLVELWIFMAILTFFVLRVLGSHTAQRLLGSISRFHQ